MDQRIILAEYVTRNPGTVNQGRAPHDVPAIDPLLTHDLRFFAGLRERTVLDGVDIPRPSYSLAPLRRALARPLRALAITLDPSLAPWSAVSLGPVGSRVSR